MGLKAACQHLAELRVAVPTSLPEHPPAPGDLVLDCDQAMRSLDAQATQPVGDTATPETTDREQTVEITLGPMSLRSGERSSRWAPLFASRQPRRVTAPGLPVMCLRMVSA